MPRRDETTDQMLARFARKARARWRRDFARMAKVKHDDELERFSYDAIKHIRAAFLLLSEQIRRETKGRRRHRRRLLWNNHTVCDMQFHQNHHADELACREILERWGDPPTRPPPRCCPQWLRVQR